VWKERYELINAFERTLAAANTIILKFFLHITKDEQKERLLAREKDPEDAWKLSIEDWKERQFWEDFTEAYEDAIGRCASADAPWIVVPANSKWYRDLVVVEAVAEALRPHRKEWRKTLDDQGKVLRKDVQEWRKTEKDP
jgi:polyphosphate kinase 2 (PPK2 family)